ncbi:MAG TPA: hypothetical protein ENK00_03660 [Chromatiales bacterium]|nr:hypothetical protein [Chromatiales bacterium]
MAETWFRRAIAEGLTRLTALSLPGTPPAETIKLTREAWVEALWEGRAWVETDAERIAAGFRSLSRRIDRWPAPKALLDHLPPRPASLRLPHKPTPEQRERNRQKLRELVARALRKGVACNE